MSAEHVGWAFRQEVGSPTRKLVLVALADRCNKDTLQCNPHIETLAADCDLGERATRQALTDLCDLGLITRERPRRGDGSRGGYEYSFPKVHEPAQLPAPDAARDAVLPDSDAARAAAPDAALVENREVLNREGTTGTKDLPAAPVAYDPIKGRRVDGRDLPWDALEEVTRAVGAVNGARMKRALASIRPIIWAFAKDRGATHEKVQSDPDGYERAVAETITLVARRMAADSPELTWGPEGVARNFAARLTRITEEPTLESTQRIVDDVLRRAS